jgi:argininosuccinate lyase
MGSQHIHHERRLGEIIGKNIIGKLHAGRSRNELRQIEQHLINFLNVIVARAESEIDYVMPGYTLQRA